VTVTFDPRKDAANLKKHGISLTEGDGVLSDPLGVTVEDESAQGEHRFVTLGTNMFGSLRVVVWTPRGTSFVLFRFVKRRQKKEGSMKKEYDFSKGKRGAVMPQAGKTRITIYFDDAILSHFKAESERTGKGYQTLLNDALKSFIGLREKPLTADMVRKIVREELSSHN
jgi:uncharacterized DUF497 family protein